GVQRAGRVGGQGRAGVRVDAGEPGGEHRAGRLPRRAGLLHVRRLRAGAPSQPAAEAERRGRRGRGGRVPDGERLRLPGGALHRPGAHQLVDVRRQVAEHRAGGGAAVRVRAGRGRAVLRHRRLRGEAAQGRRVDGVGEERARGGAGGAGGLLPARRVRADARVVLLDGGAAGPDAGDVHRRGGGGGGRAGGRGAPLVQGGRDQLAVQGRRRGRGVGGAAGPHGGDEHLRP